MVLEMCLNITDMHRNACTEKVCNSFTKFNPPHGNHDTAGG